MRRPFPRQSNGSPLQVRWFDNEESPTDADLPPDEHERLGILHSLSILDTDPEAAYDDLTRLAAFIAGTPIALISLVARDRQWFKAKVGLEAPETHRELAFCAHAIRTPDEIMVVRDAMLDRRFNANPLVTGSPHIRFYAGAPLTLSRHQALGTICVIDTVPRDLSTDQLSALAALSRQAVALLELRRNAARLRLANTRLEEFAYVASHDLRSPLRGIAELVEWIGEDLGTDASDGIRQNLARISVRAIHLDRIVQELLSYARAGGSDADHVMLEPRALIDDILATERVPPGFTVTVAATAAPLRTARAALETTLRNLVSNAINHHDGAHGCLSIRARDEDSHCVFTVADDGPGIPQRSHERVFKLFQTLAPTRRSGAGMGLAVARRLVETHGGRIELDSDPGSNRRGSTFRVFWPHFHRSGSHA